MQQPDPQTWDTIMTLFDQAAELDPKQQETFVEQLEVSDEVRTWLCKLLAGDQRTDGLIDKPVAGMAGDLLGQAGPAGGDDDDLAGDWEGREFGAYRAIRQLGKGGTSIVMLAERADGRYEQQVALKLLRPSRFTHINRDRLAEEARILAQLKHPNIAHILDAGVSDDGVPYTAMEYCEGEPITRYCDAHKLSLKARLGLLQQVCAAVHHAHRNLIVHRDIKPANILVQPDGTPKLVDFDIAGKLDMDQDQSGLALRLTPEYAAPEQFSTGTTTGTAADIYALGTLCYELLCGARPFPKPGSDMSALQNAKQNNGFKPPSQRLQSDTDSGQLQQLARERGVVTPRQLQRRIEGDLDAIVQRAMQADPGQRYASAQALAEDIERHLTHYMVSARRAGHGLQLRRWLQRNRLVALAAGGAFASLMVGFGFALWQGELARQHALRAEAVQGFLLEIFEAADPLVNQQKPIPVNDLVNQQAERINTAFSGQPETRRQLQTVLAQVQGNLGNHAQSQQIYENLLAQLQQEQVSKARLAELHTEIAEQLESQGQLDQALEHADQATGLAPIAATQHPVAVRAVRTKASILSELRRNPAAVELLTGALQQRQQILQLPEGQALLGNVLADLSEKQGMLGETETALQSLDQAMQLYQQVYPAQHPEIANAFARLAGIERAAGQFGEAALASYQAARQSRQIFGVDHSQSLRYDTSLAVDLAYLTCYRQAIDLYEGVIDRYQSLYGAENVLTGNALLNLASMKRKINAHASALEDINQTLAIYAAQTRPVTDMQAFALGIKAQLLFSLEHQDEAEQFMLNALQTMRDAVGEQHPQALRIQVSHGSMLIKSGQSQAAIDSLQPAYQHLAETLGGDSAHTKDAAAKLAAAYQQAGDNQSAQTLIDSHTLPAEQVAAQLAGPVESNAATQAQCELPAGIDLQSL